MEKSLQYRRVLLGLGFLGLIKLIPCPLGSSVFMFMALMRYQLNSNSSTVTATKVSLLQECIHGRLE
jgi:hypothetical protein